MKNAGGLLDVLLTLFVIGIIFSLTIPVLTKNNYEKEVITGFVTFNNDLQTAIDQWKKEINCPFKTGVCLKLQKELNFVNPDFTQINKYLRIVEKVDQNSNEKNYIPLKTLNYYGTGRSIYDFQTNRKRDVYLLLDGMVFSVLTDNDGYWLVVDVNGKKPPNRIGKDTFHFCVGYDTNSDVTYFPKHNTEDGLCGFLDPSNKTKCSPNNVNPLIKGGASPSSYVLINKKLPDFAALSTKISGFKK